MDKTATILIVDDEPFNVDYLEQELEELGYDTLSAADGKDALQVVDSQKPDLILLDIMMPVIDGFEVLTRLKANDETRYIPVIIISAMTDMQSIVKGIELGAEDYLPKPFDEVLLRARISSALEKKHLRDLEQAHLQSLERELEIGHQIQTGFLPETLPQKPGWYLGAFFRPAREVAGDFYDAFELPDGKVALILGDVADKGVGSALFMALYRSLLRSALNNPMLLDQPDSKLIRAVTHTNDYVCSTHEDGLFATIFVGILDPASGELAYVNAGHNPPMLIKGKIESWIMPTGPAVGMLGDQTYLSKKIIMDIGDRLFIYSDGLEDVKNGQDEFYERERLAASFIESKSSIESIVAQIDRFMMNEQQYDDLSLLIVEREV